MTRLSLRMTDGQRFSLMILATLGTLIVIAIVNLGASLAAKASANNTERILSVCVDDPHGVACQKRVLPRVFSEAGPRELARYRASIALRESQLKATGNESNP